MDPDHPPNKNDVSPQRLCLSASCFMGSRALSHNGQQNKKWWTVSLPVLHPHSADSVKIWYRHGEGKAGSLIRARTTMLGSTRNTTSCGMSEVAHSQHASAAANWKPALFIGRDTRLGCADDIRTPKAHTWVIERPIYLCRGITEWSNRTRWVGKQCFEARLGEENRTNRSGFVLYVYNSRLHLVLPRYSSIPIPSSRGKYRYLLGGDLLRSKSPLLCRRRLRGKKYKRKCKCWWPGLAVTWKRRSKSSTDLEVRKHSSPHATVTGELFALSLIEGYFGIRSDYALITSGHASPRPLGFTWFG